MLLRVNPPGRPADGYDTDIAQDAIGKAQTTDPETLVAAFDGGSRALPGQLAKFDVNPVVEYPGLEATVRLADVVRIGLIEALVHLLDVTDALGRPAQVPPFAVRETSALFLAVCGPVEFIEVATGRAAPRRFPLMK